MKLSFGYDERFVIEYLQRETGRKVSLTITDNSTSILSVRVREEALIVRMHRVLLGAGPDVFGEIAGFVKRRKGKTPLLGKFVRQHSGSIRKKPPRKLLLKPRGRYHDLGRISEAINGEYFDGRVAASITWGAQVPARGARKRTLGSFSEHTNTIRISPLLDRKAVPRYFVEFVVYHEMLHADMVVEKRGGRRVVHSKEFRRRERTFREYGRAIAWEKAHI